MGLGLSLWNVVEKTFAGKWLAGARIQDALRRVKELNGQHMSATINYLGEGFTDKRDVAEAVYTYLQLIKAIKKSKADAIISVKMTQLGLGISKAYARQNYAKIVGFARKNGITTYLDIEAQYTVDQTIAIYETQVRKGMVGIALQSYLRHSESDMKRLVREHANIRLVKGAYKENARVAFQKREEVSDNFISMMRYLFKNSKSFTIATHDQQLIEEAMALNRVYRRNVTYSMLNGIRSNYATRLAEGGNKVSIYVPFGGRWVDYAFRRMREEGHIILVLRSLLGG